VQPGQKHCAFIDLQKGKFNFHDMHDFERINDARTERPKEQWLLELKGIASLMAKFGSTD